MTAGNGRAAGRLGSKVVVVTGGESGIGRAMAARCAADGACVTIVGVDEDRLAETAKAIEDAGGRATSARADVRDPQEVDAALEHARTTFGRLDAVIANAGVSQIETPFTELRPEGWQAILDVNLTGAFLTLQAGAAHLVAQGEGGCLIATGSSTVFRPHGAKAIAYVAAKGGVHAMVRAIAFELAEHKIRVNGIAPGLTDTPMTRGMPGHIVRGLELVPMGEVVQAEELGALAAFMVSDDARHMTGSIVQLDAGRTSD